MTTYATATTQAPQAGGPPTPPLNAGGPSIQQNPRPRRNGIIAAAAAFTVAAAAAVATGAALASPITPAQRTVNVVPPPPAEYTGAEVQAAQTKACAAWDSAARITARASKESAAALEADPNSLAPASAAALTMEKRTGMTAVMYLQSTIQPATPPSISEPMNQWIVAAVDQMHAINQRDWPAESSALKRGNDLVDVIAPACGLR